MCTGPARRRVARWPMTLIPYSQTLADDIPNVGQAQRASQASHSSGAAVPGVRGGAAVRMVGGGRRAGPRGDDGEADRYADTGRGAVGNAA